MLYICTTILAAFIGLFTILPFKEFELFSIKKTEHDYTSLGTRIRCPPLDETDTSETPLYMQWQASKKAFDCVADVSKDAYLASTKFILGNENKGIEDVNEAEVKALGFSENLQKGVFYKALSN